jgi:TolB-like protein
MSDVPSFWQQLKDRRVVRVAVLYGAVGWAAIGAADVLTGVFELPDWTMQLVFVLILVGFPIALALAWAFDVTPEGVQRTGSVPGTGRRRALAAVAIVSVLWFLATPVWWRAIRQDGPAQGAAWAGEASVAVLPLENRSSIPDQGHFVNGLHDELITQLQKIEGLTVTSRTSVMGYREGGNVREIGRALGVAAVVEGGVERVGDRIRVIVQLIDAERDAHLWGETYDEVLTSENLFEIRSSLVLRIARELHASLTPDEERRIRTAPTDDLAAYDLVLRGVELYEGGPEDVEKALEFFAEATRMQPEYAEAWSWLGMAYNQRMQKGGYGPAMRDSARAAAREALRLDPEDARAHFVLRDYERALELRPNWEIPLINLSSIAWWRGRHVEGIRLMARARRTAPEDPMVAEHFADHAHYLLLDEDAERWLAECERLDPDFYWLAVFRSLYAAERGEMEVADRNLAIARRRDPGDPMVRWLDMRLGLIDRDARRVEGAAEALVRDQSEWGWWSQEVQSRVLLAWSLISQGRAEGVDALLGEAVDFARSEVERVGSESPQRLYAWAQAEMLGTGPAAGLARLEEAIDAGYPNLRLLRLDPIWDPVREDPRFLELVGVLEEGLARQRAEITDFLRAID